MPDKLDRIPIDIGTTLSEWEAFDADNGNDGMTAQLAEREKAKDWYLRQRTLENGGAVVRAVDWRDQMACAGLPPDFLFPSKGNSRELRAIKDTCMSCKAYNPCLEDAIKSPGAPAGWRAGKSEREIRKLRRQWRDEQKFAIHLVE